MLYIHKLESINGNDSHLQAPRRANVQGYLAEPEHATGAAAIVVIQEWWGVNDQIRGVADRLASAGYIALVPDLYRGKSTVEAEEAHHLMTGLNFGDAASQDIRGAVQFLKTRSGKVGVTGFCMGGALTLLALCMAPEIDAAVVWYGCPPLEYIDATKIQAPLQGHWATQDEFFPIATIDPLQDKLREAGVNFDFHRYLAHHAFANETAVGPGRIPPPSTTPSGRSRRGIALSASSAAGSDDLDGQHVLIGSGDNEIRQSNTSLIFGRLRHVQELESRPRYVERSNAIIHTLGR